MNTTETKTFTTKITAEELFSIVAKAVRKEEGLHLWPTRMTLFASREGVEVYEDDADTSLVAVMESQEATTSAPVPKVPQPPKDATQDAPLDTPTVCWGVEVGTRRDMCPERLETLYREAGVETLELIPINDLWAAVIPTSVLALVPDGRTYTALPHVSVVWERRVENFCRAVKLTPYPNWHFGWSTRTAQ